MKNDNNFTQIGKIDLNNDRKLNFLMQGVFVTIAAIGVLLIILFGLHKGGTVPTLGIVLACLIFITVHEAIHIIVMKILSPEKIECRLRLHKLFQGINAIVKDSKMTMMLQEPNITAEMLQRIIIPTTVLAGSHDMVKRSNTEYIADNIPSSKLHILQGEGHGSYVLHSTKIAKLILSVSFGERHIK